MRPTKRPAALVGRRDEGPTDVDDDPKRGRPSVWDAVETDVFILAANDRSRFPARAVVRREASPIVPALVIAAVAMLPIARLAPPAAAMAIGALIALSSYLSEGGR
jgi:hypothetical protein